MFWTELEIRRLGNLVAASINARAYVGRTAAAAAERRRMRLYLDAMKRKALRVQHRAELLAQGADPVWPGIDPTISDPVALAEEYVKVVQDYLAVLAEEDVIEAASVDDDVARDVDMPTEDDLLNDADGLPTEPAELPDEWEAADDEAYREARALNEQSKAEEEAKRAALLDDGLRQRKGADEDVTGKMSKEDEELMARHQPMQDDLTSNLVDLVGQLKESVADNRDRLNQDKKALDATEDAVDGNLSAVERQRKNLQAFSQSTSTSWWLVLGAGLLILVVFFFVLLLLKLPML